jgi:protein involved in polysaccharide export with SLBB domain
MAKRTDNRTHKRMAKTLVQKLSLAGIAVAGLGLTASCAPQSLVREAIQEGRTYKTPAPVPTAEFPAVPLFPTWTDQDDGYRLYPGDVVEFQSIGAPELNKKLTVAPDGRIHPPLLRAIMAADRTPEEIETELSGLYAAQLRNASVNITPESFASQKVFIGGEVAKPGLYDLPGEIDPLQAIMIAGGFLNSARREEVVVLRRGVGGQPFMRTFDMKSVFARQNAFAELPRLRRFDVVWVPRSRVSELGLFTQQFVREALPVTVGLNYSLGGNIR